ncbi:MAG: hypothetical protein Q8Q85_09755 [Gemmatimonadales bacterium]|nr:hypothetical protein [Gemmatimonadales bacterium]
MAHHVELANFITPARVEYAYGKACRAQELHQEIYAQVGMRAAKARDPKLLLALDRGANMLDKIAESQQGRTRRSTDVEGLKVEFTEAQLWKKAYEFADKGEPLAQLQWVYAAGAILSGLID